MAFTTAAARSLACHSCRQWMLRSFIASIGGSVVTQPSTRRPFSTPSIRLNEARERIKKEEREELNESGNDGEYAPLANEDENAPDASQQNAHVPWYLQVESPIPEQETVLSARQKIPDLPDHAPPILQPLLERISVELGMDDLSLLDLRGLDPPPALGANLLMIVGTARSEKHLHFSADKLCRWLRSEHRLSPYADGLLGRQELKLKMRRRAKRSRLLSAVGAKSTADTELDEGIRTGWICVNLGRVEGGDLPKSEEALAREENVVGFGTQTSGARIVVQLMTEEKRGEIDLEKLWTAVLKKSKKEKEALQESEEVEEAAQKPNSELGHVPSLNTGFAQQQARAYHTSARRLQATPIQEATDNPDQLSPALQGGAAGGERSPSTMTSLLDDLADMSPDAALQTLGEDFMTPMEQEDGEVAAEVTGSSDFVKSFYSGISIFSSQIHWHGHIQLLAYAHRLGHPNVTGQTLMSAIENMTIAGWTPMEKTYISVLGSLLGRIDRNGSTFEDQMGLVFDLLEEMEHYGYNALRPEILEALHRTLIGSPVSSEQPTLQSIVPALGLARLKRHLASGDMRKFWQSWNSFPRRFAPRPVEMYVVLFDAFAKDETSLDFHETRENLSYWINEMGHEEPPVEVDSGGVELAMSLFKAMKCVDPLAEIKEWNDARGKCEKVLRAALQ